MATNPSTDLTEEDAADLQFPKETYYPVLDMSEKQISTNSNVVSLRTSNFLPNFKTCEVCLSSSLCCSCIKCEKCKNSLEVPYIECTQCVNVNLCCKCFSVGSEFGAHESDHNYRIVKHDFILFEKSNWTASEELIMLEVLYIYGYGNWELIASKLQNRSIQEIKEHYDTFYIDKPASELLPKVSETEQSLFPTLVIPYRFKVFDIDEPPRYAPNTIGFESVAGYNAPRSDFEVDYDANAEQLLSTLSDLDIEPSDPSYNVLRELQCAIVRSYNRRLRERHRRKAIIREHGMILLRKNMSWMHRYDKSLTRHGTERLITYMQYFTGTGFDLFMEGLHRAAELRHRISRLHEYRQKGVTSLQAAAVYEEISREKDHMEKELTLFTSNPLFSWKNIDKVAHKIVQVQPNKRAQFRPLDIIGLPGFEKLSKKEQDLCSIVRLVPQTYLDLKELLVIENKKFGYLKLQTARRMLKIDVNKTRKLYDFLIEEGFITKPND